MRTSTCASAFEIAGRRLLVSKGREIHGTVKKLFQQLQYLDLTEDLGNLLFTSFAPQILPEILFHQRDTPDDLAQRNPLCGPARADGLVTVLDVRLGPSKQPFAKVQVDVPDCLGEFLGWDLAVGAATAAFVNLLL